MSPVDAAIVRRKLGRIIASLALLRPIAGLALEDYRARVWERKGTERVLQEAIEVAFDINAHLIAEPGAEVPDDYFGGFIKLGELAVIPPDLAQALAPSAGLRNRRPRVRGDRRCASPRGSQHCPRALSSIHPGDRGVSRQGRPVRSALAGARPMNRGVCGG